jgi:hypothetical protein
MNKDELIALDDRGIGAWDPGPGPHTSPTPSLSNGSTGWFTRIPFRCASNRGHAQADRGPAPRGESLYGSYRRLPHKIPCRRQQRVTDLPARSGPPPLAENEGARCLATVSYSPAARGLDEFYSRDDGKKWLLVPP